MCVEVTMKVVGEPQRRGLLIALGSHGETTRPPELRAHPGASITDKLLLIHTLIIQSNKK